MVVGPARAQSRGGTLSSRRIGGFEGPSVRAIQTLLAGPGTVRAQCPRMGVLAACLAAVDFREVWALVLA